MNENKTQWNFTVVELLFHMEISGIKPGELCLIPQNWVDEPKIGQDQVAQKRSEMAPEELGLLEHCLGVLADPDRVLNVHINLGDGAVSRFALGNTQTSPGMWVGLGHEGEAYSILLHGDSELKYGLINSLAAGIPLGETQIGCDLSTPAALTFLGVLDQYKQSHMLSMLNHAEPVSIFTKEDIEKHLSSSNIHDFRWLLPFTDKLMPLRINQLGVSEDADQALSELVELKIIGNVDEESRFFDLEPITLSIAEGYRQKISVAGIGHTARLTTGEFVHDVFVLIRTPGDLLLTVMSGGEASLVGISAEELQNLLDSLLINLPLKENQSGEQRQVEEMARKEITEVNDMESPKRFCKECGSAVSLDAKFCGNCGIGL